MYITDNTFMDYMLFYKFVVFINTHINTSNNKMLHKIIKNCAA